MLDVQYTSNQHHVKFFNINFPPGLNPIRDYIYIYIYMYRTVYKNITEQMQYTSVADAVRTLPRNMILMSHTSLTALWRSLLPLQPCHWGRWWDRLHRSYNDDHNLRIYSQGSTCMLDSSSFVWKWCLRWTRPGVSDASAAPRATPSWPSGAYKFFRSIYISASNASQCSEHMGIWVMQTIFTESGRLALFCVLLVLLWTDLPCIVTSWSLIMRSLLLFMGW